MNSHKQTKRALLTSVMALVMCVVMLVGTTFAWFTDTATANVNKIQAGNLNVELYYGDTADGADGTNWTKLDNNSAPLSFLQYNGTSVEQKDFYWEPGGTYSLPALKVVNEGNLNLKYKIEITGIKGSDKLNEVIDWTMKLGSDEFVIGSEHVLNAPVGNAESAAILTIQGRMQETAGNTYMNETIDGIAITLKATQATGEYDSTRNDYDESATYPDVAFSTVGSSTELADAITNAKDANGKSTNKVSVKLTKDDTYTLPVLDNKDIAITGTKGTVIDMATAGNQVRKANSVSFDGVTVNFANANYTGFQHTGKLTYKNCTITGMQFLYAEEVEFINCKFEQTDANAYNLWTYTAKNILFNNCEFSCAGKSVLVYHEGGLSELQTVTFENCKMTATSAVAGKAAIEIDTSFMAGGAKVVIDQATADSVTGFGTGSVSGNSVWNNKKGSNATVVLAGTTVLSVG